MARSADPTGPGAFNEAQANAYAAAREVETEFPHDRVFVDLLRRHARGTVLDLGGGTGRYAAWLLRTGLATAAQVIDQSLPMVDTCRSRGVPGLSAHVGDLETAELGRGHYDLALARFVLMHIRDLEGTVTRIAMGLKQHGALAIVTNILEGPSTAVSTVAGETPRTVRLVLQATGGPIHVVNYVRTQEDYLKAVQQAGLRIEFSGTYAPQILRLEADQPGLTLSHLVLLGRK